MLTPSNSALFPLLAPGQRGGRLPWYVAVIGCVSFAWLGIGFQKTIPIFVNLFNGLGVEIPFPAQLLLSNYTWLIPILYLAAILLTIIKQFASLNKLQNRIANYFLFFAGVIFPPLVVLALYSPLFLLIHRLQGGK